MSDPLMIHQLSHRYTTQTVLHDINLTVAPGEFLSLLGTSGCGKSTLLRLISGLEQPYRGEIYLAGKAVFANGRSLVPTERRHLGFVFQDYALFPQQTVWQNIAFGLPQIGKSQRAYARQRVTQLLELIDMTAYADRYPCALSGGQQQRVALARALAPKPTLLLLDEPFANIDATIRQELGQALQAIVTQEQVSVILVTHDRREAFALADRVAILQRSDQGTYIAQCDTPEQVYHYPINPTVAILSGNVSLLPAHAAGDRATTILGDIPLLQPTHGAGKIILRPQMATFTPDRTGNATIVNRIFHGHCYHLVCRVNDILLEAEVPLSAEVTIGDHGHIRVQAACLMLVE
jgi:iron(III) transport system ATP-binding protein